MKDFEIRRLLIAEDLCRRIEKTLACEAYMVGGATRAIVVGEPIADIDITVGGGISDLLKSDEFPVVDESGLRFGSCRIKFHEEIFDVTAMRGSERWDGGELRSFERTVDTKTDAGRRDFTINAGYMRVEDGGKIVIHDPLDAFWEALAKREIRFVGNPVDRIREDPLRMLRAFRISAQMGWDIEPASQKAIVDSVGLVADIPPERVRGELNKLLLVPCYRIGPAMKRMYTCGLLVHILPELHFAMTVEQNKHHGETVGEHLLLTVSAVRKRNLLLRWAALLHDIAKPKTKVFSKKKQDFTFYNHEVESAFDAKMIMRRLKFSNREIDYVFRLIFHHMFYISKNTKPSTIRHRMRLVGPDKIRDLLRLRIADRAGNLAKESGITYHLKLLLRMIRKVERDDMALKVTDLKFRGHDAMALGLKGPEIGKLLTYLLERCIANPGLNRLPTLRKLAKEWRVD